jgi:hypothetical protein
MQLRRCFVRAYVCVSACADDCRVCLHVMRRDALPSVASYP